MEKSETQNAIINLGKLLVKELSLEKTSDTLGRWMAHYIASKIDLAERAKGKVKSKAMEDCSRLILEFWKHRWVIQNKHNPLRDFDQLFNLLQRIDPGAFNPYYYNQTIKKKRKEKSDFWSDAAYDLDKAARICLKYMLHRAAGTQKSADTDELLQTATVISPDADLEVIRMLLDEKDYDLDPNNLNLDSTGFNKDFDKASVKNQIEYLDKLVKHAKTIKSALQKEINAAGK